MIHDMSLGQDAFGRVKLGKKKIEVRLLDEKRKKIKIGDEIVFFKLPKKIESIKARVYGLSYFKNFRDLFEIFGKQIFGHSDSITTEKQVKDMYNYYTKEEEQYLGVLAIHIRI